jgi:membrane-associated protease RseP (regulator of RpoE activity)
MILFLTIKRKNLQKEGMFFLYRTKWGMRLIDYIGNKYKRTIKFLSYISIGLGYFLMAGIIYMFYIILRVYLFMPDVVKQLKVPPLMPLVPYVDRLVPGLPEFYFVYWIILIAVIAVVHEFAHGIFAARNKIKIKSTGFGFFPFFLPVFLAAFVEQDEKDMEKTSRFKQMAVLSAGTFANIITGIFFFFIMWIFFSLAFTPAGIIVNTNIQTLPSVMGEINVNGVSLENHSYEQILSLMNETGLNSFKIDNINYVASKDLISNSQNEKLYNEENSLFLYYDSPAIRAGLSGIITQVNNKKITSVNDLNEELLKYSPNDEITIQTKTDEGILNYTIVLETSPLNKSKSWLGISYVSPIGGIAGLITSFKEPSVYYEPKINGLSLFIYNMLWWITIANIFVAFFNMLPVGIFDGGRFFYLTVLAITKSEKKAKRMYSFSTYLFLLVLFLLMFFWAISFF